MKALSRRQSNFLVSLVEARIPFLLIGGRALNVHGSPRPSYDLDLLIDHNGGSAAALFEEVVRYTGRRPTFSLEALMRPRARIQLTGIDILTSIDGIDFLSALNASVPALIGGVPVRVMAVRDLVRAKTVSMEANESRDAKSRDERDLAFLRTLLNE